MDEATRQRAIEPFFSTKGVGKGTGLGLSMVHGLAGQLGGALQIRSEVGVGTVVELWLPVSDDTSQEGEAPVEAEAPVSLQDRGLVLLVDDEPLVRMTTAEMLVGLGYSVVEAVSGAEALHLLATGLKPSLLVTDYMMPEMTGGELAKTVRSAGLDFPVLLVSGYAEENGLPPDLPRLRKPFTEAEIGKAVSSLAHG